MAFNLGGMAAAINQAINANIDPAVAAQATIGNPPLPPWILPPPGGTGAALPPLPPLPVTDPVMAWQWDFASINAFKQAQRGRNKNQMGAAWLASEAKWKDRVGKDWRPVRVLGRGGQGIVGHWTYGGLDRHLRKLNDVAVKQAVRSGPYHVWGDGLETEARLLMLFQPIKTQHVVKMYRHMYEDAGQKTDQFDYGVVHRIFLEYCPGGDLSGWLGKYMNNNKNVPEYEMWCVFTCLAKALLVIHSGSEDSKQPRWSVPEIVHLDLKPENVLVGDFVTDSEHRNMPSFKISDFGLAQEVPSVQDKKYLNNLRGVGTVPWWLPEQIQTRDHPALTREFPGERPWMGFWSNLCKNPRLGTASNIWQIGMIMYVLMRKSMRRCPNWGGNGDFWQDRTKLMCYQSKMTPRLKTGGATVGCSRDVDAEKLPQDSMYSKELRALIAECLLVTPASRIPAAELVDRTTKNLDTLRMSKGMANGPFQEFEEPQLSQRWYSDQLNGNSANAAPVPIPNPAAQPFNQLGQAKPNAGAQAVVPPNQPQVPQIPIAPDPAPMSSGVIVNISPPANMPGANPAAADGLYPTPDPLVVIVLHRPGLFGYGARNHATYRLTGLTSTNTVKVIIDALVNQGVKEPFTLMHGRQLMIEPMKLGEFKNLQNIRATEIY